MKKLALIAAALALFAAAPAEAAPVKYTYDKLHSQILFSVDHMGFTRSHGRFNKFDGTFMLDEQNPEGSSAEITIDTNSVDMADATWDEHVKEKFLETAKFPAMSFRSTKIVRTGEKTATMTGDLTLHGVTKPVTLDVVLNQIGPHPMAKERRDAGFTLTGKLKRSDFGMSGAIPLVGDDVALTIEVHGMGESVVNP
jgi:polyisoprenoid-binding protein YceI